MSVRVLVPFQMLEPQLELKVVGKAFGGLETVLEVTLMEVQEEEAMVPVPVLMTEPQLELRVGKVFEML